MQRIIAITFLSAFAVNTIQYIWPNIRYYTTLFFMYYFIYIYIRRNSNVQYIKNYVQQNTITQDFFDKKNKNMYQNIFANITSFCDPNTLDNLAEVNQTCKEAVIYTTVNIEIQLYVAKAATEPAGTVFLSNKTAWMSMKRFKNAQFVYSFQIGVHWHYTQPLTNEQVSIKIIIDCINMHVYLKKKIIKQIIMYIPVHVQNFWNSQKQTRTNFSIIQHCLKNVNCMDPHQYMIPQTQITKKTINI